MIPLVYEKGRWWTAKAHTVEVLGHIITVPIGFDTDLASIPRIFWAVYPPFGVYMRAAIVHDFLYRKTELPEIICDNIFYIIMKADGVGFITRFLFYSVVRTVGCRSMLK